MTGKIIKCMETVYSLGLTAELTKEHTSMIKKKDTALLPGPMAVSTLAHGLTASRMVWEPIPQQLENQNRVSGEKESVLRGFEHLLKFLDLNQLTLS